MAGKVKGSSQGLKMIFGKKTSGKFKKKYGPKAEKPKKYMKSF